ncbi:MAG TPA: amino acid permease [Cyclobacteriaceae bacterium]|nr:amino acid permease [Cyclobacteriaceae bacterium]
MSIKPKLGLFDLTMVTVSLVIGMGIFRTPVEVANKAGTPTVLFAAWIVGAVVSLFGALTFAEIGSRYHVTGGFYRIFSHCYHPAFAFMVNWMTVISNAGSTAIVAIIGAEYINPLILPNVDRDLGIKITTISAIVILYAVNMIGIKMSARTLNVLMIIKIAMMALLITAVFLPTEAHEVKVTAMPFGDQVHSFWLCFLPVFFTYGGYQQTMNFGSDVPNATRTMPRAIFFGIAIILVLYLLLNFSYYHVLGMDGIQNSTALASDMAAQIFGPYASRVVAVVMFLSVMAYVNASIMSNPRVYYAMAEEKVLPSVFARTNPKTQVLEFSTTFFVAFMVITLFLTSSFSKVLNYVMFFDSISLIAASAAIFVLRYRAKKNGEQPGVYKMPLYPWLPAIFVITYTLVNISILVSNPFASFIGFVLFLSGWPLFLGLKKIIAT